MKSSSSYTAASFPRVMELADKHGANLEGALTWAFTFEDQPPFAGFRQLASAGIDHPVLNVFRMFGKMSGQRIISTSSAGLNADRILAENVLGVADVCAQACLDKKSLAVLVWHYHDDDLPSPQAMVSLSIGGLPLKNGQVELTHFRVDADHSNAYEAWKKLGSPSELTPEQFGLLEQAGKLEQLNQPTSITVAESHVDLKFNLPRQAVSLLLLSWK